MGVLDMANGTHLVSSIPLSLIISVAVGLLWPQLSRRLRFHYMKNKFTRHLGCVFFQMPDKIEAKLLQPPWKSCITERHKWDDAFKEQVAMKALRSYMKPQNKAILQILLKSGLWLQRRLHYLQGFKLSWIAGTCLLLPFLQILSKIPNT